MSIFYFDTEATSLDPDWGKTITAQWKKLHHGQPDWDENEFHILKEWELESGEKGLIQELIDLGVFDYRGEAAWNFIPCGNGLGFDTTYLYHRARKYGLLTDFDLEVFIREKPMVDLRSVLILMNDLEFRGSGLHEFTTKLRGDQIPYWYQNQEYDRILEYIDREQTAFIGLLREVRPTLMILGDRLRKKKQLLKDLR